MAPMHAQGGLPIPGVVHIRQPYWYGEGGDLSPEEFGLVAARALEDKILEIGAERVGAFIGEPIQGAGGVIIPPPTYWPEIQRIVDRYGILLVADEVICGFGRTGRWFGADYFGIRPDLMPIAKGMSVTNTNPSVYCRRRVLVKGTPCVTGTMGTSARAASSRR